MRVHRRGPRGSRRPRSMTSVTRTGTQDRLLRANGYLTAGSVRLGPQPFGYRLTPSDS